MSRPWDRSRAAGPGDEGGRSETATFTWTFDSPVAAVWPAMADTARFNEAAELPKHEVDERPQPDGSVRYFGSTRFGPFSLRWEEEPVNWVHERWFEHCRHFSVGPFSLVRAHFEIFPAASGGCRGEYTLTMVARNVFGRLMLASGAVARTGRRFSRLADDAREFSAGRSDTGFRTPPPRLAADARARADGIAARIESSPHGHGLARRLTGLVLTAAEVEVWSIRPLALARAWQVPERHAVELCLEGVRQGLLALRWELLCPRCRIGKSGALALDQLPRGAHCATCNIDYERSYSRNVELVFQPARGIREVTGGEYCLFGPMSTPHVRIQLAVAAGERREVDAALAHGHYRVRTLEPGDEQRLEWRDGGFPEVIVEREQIDLGLPAPAGKIVLDNRGPRPLVFIVEELSWARDALTARRATALQAFRDLFNEQVLRPGDDVEIDHITIMFTDLKGSSALYERVGDPEAYRLVREHFAVLGRAVRDHDGAIVKTIGDAIMAVFADPGDGLACAIRIHDDFAARASESRDEPMTIKIGLHAGRCISVTLNDRLDYYGTAANKAARLQGMSTGGDVVMSPEYAADPGVAPMLEALRPQEESAALKGYADPVTFLRVTAETLAARRRME